MKTLLTIDTHAGIENFLPAMWPHYERAGVDILGIERTNKPTRWPKPIPTIAIGIDLFQRWSTHRSPTLLCERVLDSMEALLTDPKFNVYSDFCMSTWSVFFAHPLPPMPAPLVLHQAGGPYTGLSAPYFFHHPRWFNREVGTVLLKTGRTLLAEGRTEKGADDFFFGLMVHTAGLPWHNVHTITSNSLESREQVQYARKSIAKGAWWVGNIKDATQLAKLTA